MIHHLMPGNICKLSQTHDGRWCASYKGNIIALAKSKDYIIRTITKGLHTTAKKYGVTQIEEVEEKIDICPPMTTSKPSKLTDKQKFLMLMHDVGLITEIEIGRMSNNTYIHCLWHGKVVSFSFNQDGSFHSL